MKPRGLIPLAGLCISAVFSLSPAQVGTVPSTSNTNHIKPIPPSSYAPTQAVFQVNIDTSGKYYVSFIVDGLASHVYAVRIDGKTEGYLVLEDDGIQSVHLQERQGHASKTVSLQSGTHTFVISGGRNGEVPNALSINIGHTTAESSISVPRIAPPLSTTDDSVKAHASAFSSQAQALAAASAPNPLYDYPAIVNRSFTYSYFERMALTSGTTISWEVRPSPGIPNPSATIFFFNENDPMDGGSWGDASWPNPNISVTVSTTGTYAILVLGGGTKTYCDLYKNNALYKSRIQVSWSFWHLDPSPCGTSDSLNFFTAKLSPGGDTRIFLLEGGLRKVIGYNDDYTGSGDFRWGYSSRKKLANHPSGVYTGVIAYSPYGEGTCDLYERQRKSDIWQYSTSFPNVKQDDAIRSSPESYDYNCIAWSGGVTGDHIWPPSDDRWRGSDALSSFDNYYNNYPTLRYAGAINYPTRVAPSTSGVEIDLWANDSSPYYYTHASCTNNANGHTHGYDWESKPGALSRTYHPRDALNGGTYGNVVWSYKRAGTAAGAAMEVQANGSLDPEYALTPKARALGITRPLTLDSSIALGLTVRRNIGFGKDETDKIDALVNKMPASDKTKFGSLYTKWQTVCASPELAALSDPREYAKPVEYARLRDFCLNQGTAVWPVLFRKLDTNFPFVPMLLEDVLASASKAEMQAANSAYAGNQYTSDGAFIYTTNKDRWITVCKSLLNSRL